MEEPSGGKVFNIGKKELAAIKKNYGSPDLNQVMDSLFKKNIKFNMQCVNEIHKYLNLFPEAAGEIPDFLLKGLSLDQRAMLVNALQSNKSVYSQKALLRIIKGGEFPPESRVQSAIAMGDITKPGADIIQGLLLMYYKRDNSSDLSVKLSDTSLLSLSRIAGAMSHGKSREDAAVVFEIKKKIEAEFSNAADPGHLSTVIYAAGNTGDKNFIGPISDCFQSEASVVRSAVAQSLSLINDKKIDSILAGQLKIEGEISVKSNIVKSLYDMKTSDKAVETVCEKIQNEENEIVRGEMYRFLLKNRKRSGVMDVLRKMMVSESSMENRDIISRALATRK